MSPFITGSHAYGTPQPSSDIDLVLRVSPETKNKLLKLSGGKIPVRFGKLNLILCETDHEYAVWKVGTEQMRRDKKKFNKEEARKVFDELRDLVGIEDQRGSGR